MRFLDVVHFFVVQVSCRIFTSNSSRFKIPDFELEKRRQYLIRKYIFEVYILHDARNIHDEKVHDI